MRHKPLARFTAAAILFSVGLISSFAAQTAAKQSGKAAQNTTQSNGVRLPEVHLDGAYFTRDGKRFIPMGAHWVPAKTAMQWPVQWDPKDIEADFAKMHELGYSIVRFDVMWAWFEPRPGDYNPVAFQQLDYLVSLAHKYQIYHHPSLFIGGEGWRSLLGRALATWTPSPRGSGDVAPGNQSCRRVRPPLRERECNYWVGPYRRATLLDRRWHDHRCHGRQLDSPDRRWRPGVRQTSPCSRRNQRRRNYTRAISRGQHSQVCRFFERPPLHALCS